MRALENDPQEVNAGVRQLELVRDREIERGQIFSAINTTNMIVAALFRSNQLENSEAVVALIDETLEAAGDKIEALEPSVLRLLFLNLFQAHKNLDNKDLAVDAINKSIQMSEKRYGHDASQTTVLRKHRLDVLNGTSSVEHGGK